MPPQELLVENAMLVKYLLRRLDSMEEDIGETRSMLETIYNGPAKDEDCERWNELESYLRMPPRLIL